VSVITQEDIQRRPPANDIADLIRTQPGVNLTGASSSGAFGNNRQIDLRGMGPENTLILVDGKPVQSRNAVKMGRNGERDTRGDTNWVPADSIERIEVIRGPAAARYGSGSAGGVINIITKKPTDRISGSVTTYFGLPEHSEEGDTQRLGFNFTGPLSEVLSFRLYGNVARTDADSASLNAAASGVNSTATTVPPAGREGVRNRDVNALLRWDLTPRQVLEFEMGHSRQGNIYAGERLISATGSALISSLVGAETNITQRQTASLAHRGKWDIGDSRLLFQYEKTRRSNYPVGNGGSSEGSITETGSMITSNLENYFLNGELNTPLKLGGLDQVLTSGFEARYEKLDDPGAMALAASNTNGTGGFVPGLGTGTRSGQSDATTFAFFLEDNIEITTPFILTPGVRFDHHDQFGNNWSPSLNASYTLTPEITLKGGVARAFKAPNLYQANPNYLYYTMGMGCPDNYGNLGAGCYIQGNSDLQAETSVNKEIGIAYSSRGWDAGITYFRNDYKNKIHADMFDQGTPTLGGASQVFRWVNAAKAVVQGFEGNFNVPILGESGSRLKLLNNFTYMIENKNKTTDQPLSIIPRYTINSTLDWRATEKLSAQATATFYGRQKPRSLTVSGATSTGTQTNVRGSYAVYGVGLNYEFNKNYRAGFGVNNLFDKRLFRADVAGGDGALTYNEPGRAYYVTFTGSF